MSWFTKIKWTTCGICGRAKSKSDSVKSELWVSRESMRGLGWRAFRKVLEERRGERRAASGRKGEKNYRAESSGRRKSRRRRPGRLGGGKARRGELMICGSLSSVLALQEWPSRAAWKASWLSGVVTGAPSSLPLTDLFTFQRLDPAQKKMIRGSQGINIL